jgi:protocatechuate 3,4-dioxygenase beta subunit
MRTWAIVLFVLASLPVAAHAQAPVAAAPAEAIVRGQVVADDGQPLAGVHVSLRGRPDVGATTSDAFGSFVLSLPAPRQHQLVLCKAGFEPQLISVAATALASARLRQRAVVTGRVIDDAGEPVVGAIVSAAGLSGVSERSVATDDRGEYRLTVPAGAAFVVSSTTLASADVSATFSVAPLRHVVFFPGVDLEEAATPLTLSPGETREAIDLLVPTERTLRQPGRGLDAIPVMASLATADDGVALMRGRVADVAGRPLPNTLVVLAGEAAGGTLRMARTDAAGGFEFRDVRQGRHRVVASRPGYAPETARPEVRADQTAPVDVLLEMTPLAAISGRVVDEFGEPLEGARVQAMRIRDNGSRRHLVPVESVDAVSDDRGEYRLFGLDAAAYLVTASTARTGGIELLGYLRAYAPRSGADQVTTIRVGPGQEISSLDLQMPRGPTFRVRGQVFRASGTPGLSGALQLWPSQRPGLTPGVPLDARIDANGRFEFQNVPDGAYVIQARQRRENPSTEGEFGALPVVVRGADVGDLVLTTSPGSTVAGAVVFETAGLTDEPAPTDIELAPLPADPDLAPVDNWATAGVTGDWNFAIAGVSGPRRLLPTRLPRGWALKEVRASGVDITDQRLSFGAANQSIADIEVVLTDRPSTLAGRVADATGRAVAGRRVVAFSPSQDTWYPGSRYLQEVVTNRNGAFAAVGLPPGGYFVVVLPASARDDANWWREPEVLESLMSTSTFVTVDEGSRTTVQLRP